ncbi:MAG: hypothetical protein ACFE0S_01790 [Rhodospirillales bacterium]
MKIENRSFHPDTNGEKSAVSVPTVRIELDLAGIDKIRPEKSVATLASELKNLVRRDQRDQKAKRRTRDRSG